MSALPRPIPGQHAGRQLEVLGKVHPNHLGSEIQQQRRVELAALNRRRRVIEEIAEIEAEDIDDLHFGFVGPDGGEGLQVSFTRLSRDDEEFADACPLFPRLDKFVHHPVQRSAAEGSTAGKRPCRGMDPVLDGGDAGNAERLRQIICQPFYNYCIAAEWKVGPMLFGSADGHDERGPQQEALPYRARIHFLQPPGVPLLIHRGRLWVLIIVAAGGATAEWLRHTSAAWVWIAWVCVAAALVVLWPLAGWRKRALAVLLFGLAVSLTVSHRQLKAIETRWAQEREERVTAASQRLAGDLHSALHRAERLAEAAIASSPEDQEAALDVLDRLVPSAGPEMSVVVFDRQGAPWAWAGRHRLPPRSEGDSVAARASGYYVVLEARRHSPDGRSAVAGVLVWAHPAVPDRSRSLAELFRGRTEVGLAVYPAGTAPDSPDVFDYEEPTTAGSRLLFSVQPIPPEQGAAKELVFHRASRAAVWLVLLTLGLGLTLATRPAERFFLLTTLLWLGARAPVGPALGVQSLFSPATFFRQLLGPLSTSAGVLAMAGILLTMSGVWLWRRRLPRRWYGITLGAVLLLASPYLISSLGRGITPPARGVSVGLWLTWQLTLLVAASAFIVNAASLFRGNGAESHTRWRIIAGVAIAFAAAVIGLLVWSPRGGWPDWYTFLWTPALLLVALPAPRWAAISGIALVAGSSAALVTWGAELSGRLQMAQRDVARLGTEPDPLALPLLERFGDQVRHAAPPSNASEMYALWHGSALGDQGYPAHLALWSRSGELRDQLTLDSLDLPLSLLSTLVRNLASGDSLHVAQLTRVPGVHYVLLLRLTPREVMTASVGPRSELILPGRVGRLLNPSRRYAPLYTLTLSPPAGTAEPEPAPPRWRREGWSLRSEYPLVLPDGTRLIHAAIDLRGPVPLFVRGVLVVLLDAAVLALLWFVAELAAGARPPRPRWRTLARSFRIRLAVTLGVFFVLPAVGFATWSFARLANEAQRSRDLLITQALRDAVLTAGGILRNEASPPERLQELSRRIDADLALYKGGTLAGTSTAVLKDLGVLGQLMDPDAFTALALEGELEVTRDGSIPQLAERVGYRIFQPGTPTEIGVLATPQLADDPLLGVRQLDLALVLLLATLAGVAAALAGAQIAARTLSRPVAELRRSALALGKGQPMPQHSERLPLEFEPVFAAFERMAADIRSSQSALEDARRRTATVLATVATGVVGLDPRGRVLIANRQAVDLLGTELEEGEPFLERLTGEWQPLASAVRRFLGDPATDGTAEVEVGGRRLTLQLASLGPDVRGVVMALNDVTDVSRAERVLAWGEMARQVAHEIKNPLTPMRLGMQHLQRVYRDRRGEFDQTLDETSERILAEIDRLDTIARAFSRFAAPEDQNQSLDRVDLAGAVNEVVQLYRLAEEGCEVRLTAEPDAFGAARVDEVKEVLVNLLENARNAGARVVEVTVGPGLIRVRDDGVGIPADLLPRVFEPRFSTTTSGSGLGLAIVRRLVESWGGRVEVGSGPGQGTTVTVQLPG
jgi:two-component system nitrogen regulation sensor histidine kinase NtrY